MVPLSHSLDHYSLRAQALFGDGVWLCETIGVPDKASRTRTSRGAQSLTRSMRLVLAYGRSAYGWTESRHNSIQLAAHERMISFHAANKLPGQDGRQDLSIVRVAQPRYRGP
jgi:hypothetical protein